MTAQKHDHDDERRQQMREELVRYQAELDQAKAASADLGPQLDAVNDDQLGDLNPEKVRHLIADAWAALDAQDRAERLAYDEAHRISGTTMQSDEHGMIEFVRGGRRLALVHRDLLIGPGDLEVEREFVSDHVDGELQQLTEDEGGDR